MLEAVAAGQFDELGPHIDSVGRLRDEKIFGADEDFLALAHRLLGDWLRYRAWRDWGSTVISGLHP